MNNPLKTLHEFGQSPWIDFLSRDFVADGSLKKMVEQDGLGGLTSNPAIFAAAIEKGGVYDEELVKLRGELGNDADPWTMFERIAVADVRSAADVLAPVFKSSGGRDGFVSLEVSPALANDTEGTIKEAHRLWKAVSRPNLMIKVPGTKAGLPAIAKLLGEGVNVNITLLFAQSVYGQVVDAYFDGLENFAKNGGDVSKVASVASFFVSRIDTAVDTQIEKALAPLSGEKRDALAALRGKIAIANAKLAYQLYKKRSAEPRWAALAAKGARPQRLLWASTSTKNPALRDVLYVEELIGRDTVNTMPPATVDGFRDHGKVRNSLEENVAEAEQQMKTLAQAGISLDEITDKLVVDGVRLFAEAADKLMATIVRKAPAVAARKRSGER